ncbi:MAG: hypothetical protein JOZ41_20735 [Chloroflexi bacterium]|nr:hypothetical protein [Chloroflexota bacterium]
MLELIVANYNAGQITEDEAIARVERQGFNDVVRRFHVVNGGEIGTRFYDWTGARITHLTDDLLRLCEDAGAATPRGELQSRWDL